MMTKQKNIGIGIIGVGSRGLSCLGRGIADSCNETGFMVNAVCDRNLERTMEAAEFLCNEFAKKGVTISPKRYQDAADLINDPAVDCILITSPSNCHREHVLLALQSGKKVYCDKPLAHNAEDAVAIVEAEMKTDNPLIMGFTRRYELPWIKAYSLLKEGVIGDLVMIQIRSIIPYSLYLTGWWRKRKWSGGALNDKGAHLFDVFNWFAESRAVKVHAFGGKSMIIPGPSAPARCGECKRENCLYRQRSKEAKFQDNPLDKRHTRHLGDSWEYETEEEYQDDICVYAPGSDLYHNAAVHFLYENGVIASLLYTILGPDSEDQETLELVGKTGRIILTRHTGTIDVVRSCNNKNEIIDCKKDNFGESHFGADAELIKELRRFCEGAEPAVSARCGLEATRMVMAALKSMDEDGQNVEIGEIVDASI